MEDNFSMQLAGSDQVKVMKIPTVPAHSVNVNTSDEGDRKWDRELIDALCESSEQSYEQFMNNFITLTPRDVHSASASRIQVPKSLTASAEAPCPRHLVWEVDNGGAEPPDAKEVAAHFESGIEEEILEMGTRVSDVLLRDPGKKSIKVDNFVDDEEKEVEWTEGGYCASFGNEGERDADHFARANGSSTSLCEVENHTCTLSTNEIVSRLKPVVNEPEDDLLEMVGEGEEAASDGEENPDDFEPDFYPESSADLKTFHDDHDGGEMIYDASLDLLNPGEIEDESENDQRTLSSITELQFSVKQTNEATSECSEPSDEIVSDAVEEFHLDDDFDYDNVTLTPKFSAAEMQIIMASRTQAPDAT